MKVLFLLFSGVSAVLTSSFRCPAKECETCVVQTGCVWQSLTQTCVEKASCVPADACVDRGATCAHRAMLAKAIQEGRVETQVFSAFHQATAQQQASFTCQKDECSTTQDPENVCKVVAGVNFEVRNPDPAEDPWTLTNKYMYVCICAKDWDSGPSNRYCRRRQQQSGATTLVPFGSPYETYPGYGHPYSNKAPSFTPYLPFPASPVPYNPNSPRVRPRQHIVGSPPVANSPPLANTPPKPPDENTMQESQSSMDYEIPNFSQETPYVTDPYSPHIEPPIDQHSMDIFPPAPVGNPFAPIDDEYGPYKEVIIPSDDYPRNRTTLASLLPTIEEDEDEIEEDDGKGYIMIGSKVVKKNSTTPKNPNKKKEDKDKRPGNGGVWYPGINGGKGSGSGDGGGKRGDPDPEEVPLAPTSIPPTIAHATPLPFVAPLPPYTWQPADQARLEVLEILVYTLSATLVLAALCVFGYFVCQRRKTVPKKVPPSTKPRRELELTPIPFSLGDMDPEYSQNDDASMVEMPELSGEDLSAVGQKACEDAWAKLGGLPGKGMSQVIIYYGTPYASVVRHGESTRSITEDCRSDVLVDVTLSPEDSVRGSSVQTRAKFRYVLRRDASQSSCSESHSTNLSLMSSNSACSSSASGTEY